MLKKANKTTGMYLEEMKENARKLEKKCEIASEFHKGILNKYKYDYMELVIDEENDCYKQDENGEYIYRDKTEDEWCYEDAMIAKEIVKAIEKAIESYCFLD